jgi:AcrR family transcriptional regulator
MTNETTKTRVRTSKSSGEVKTVLGPDDWIGEAMKLLVSKSVDGVRVEVLAKNLGVTRGSFYHHFLDREDLLMRLLGAWKRRQTEQVIARYEQSNPTPQGRIQELIGLPFRGEAAREGGSVELAIRAWARRDELPRSVVIEVDEQRTNYIRYCFELLGFDKPNQRKRAFILYGYMQSESIFRLPGNTKERQERREFVFKLLCDASS